MPGHKGNDFESQAMPHLDAVYRAALALCRNAATAEDLAQATYLKAMQNFASFQAGTNCKAWMMRILRNTWIDQLRRGQAVRFVSLADQMQLQANEDQAQPPEPQTDVDVEAMLEGFSDQQVLDALLELNEDQRLTLLLVDVEQMDLADAAAVLEVPVGTIKSRASRARGLLKVKLSAHAKDMGFLRRK